MANRKYPSFFRPFFIIAMRPIVCSRCPKDGKKYFLYFLCNAMVDVPVATASYCHGSPAQGDHHKYGYVSFKVNNTSKNLFPLDFLMLGEGCHNNHHKFGNRSNFGVKWFEFDPVYPFILLFLKLGII